MPRSPLPPLALAYHGVARVRIRDDPSLLFVPPEQIARHIRKLRSWGYELVPFSEFARCVCAGSAAGRAALTFDDGLIDNLESLPPLLESEDASATVFVPSGLLGQAHPHAPQTRVMTPTEVHELRRSGVEIGAHTRTHADLTALDRDTAAAEIQAGKRELEELLNEPVETMSYPYGRADARVRELAREAGILGACRTSGEGNWADALDIPRQDMTNASSMLGLRLKRDERYEPLMRRLPFRAARAARRRALAAASR